MKQVLSIVALSLAASTLVAAQSSSGEHHVLSGVVSKIDHAAKTVAVKTRDGATVVVHETEKTLEHGAAAAKEGGHMVVHYSTQAGRAVGHTVKHVGQKALSTTKGVVTKVDSTARTVTIRTAQGAEHVYHVAEDGVVSAGKATGHAAAETWGHLEDTARKGANLTVHFTEEAGRRVAHAVGHDK